MLVLTGHFLVNLLILTISFNQTEHSFCYVGLCLSFMSINLAGEKRMTILFIM